MTKQDLDFILKVLQDESANSGDADWYSVMGYLELNRVSGPFYNNAVKLGIELPPQVKRKCANTLAYQKARNAAMSEWAERIGAGLCKQGIKHAFLKGAILSKYKIHRLDMTGQLNPMWKPHTALYEERLYTDGERTSNDIDILIDQKDISKLSAILSALGFGQGYWDFNLNCFCALSRAEIVSRRMNRGETAPYILKLENGIIDFIEVDINFSLDHLPGGDSVAYFLSDAQKYGGKLYGLEGTKFFLHLLLHQYKESTVYSMVRRGKDTELYKYLDIYLYIKKGLPDYERLEKLITDLDLETECFYVLHNAVEIFYNLRNDIQLVNFLKRAPRDFKYTGEVSDPENKGKRYCWTKPLRERMTTLNGAPFLREISAGCYRGITAENNGGSRFISKFTGRE